MAEITPRYSYTALPPDCIRVLELQSAPAADVPLRGKLVVQQIADDYEALSYVWGDPTPADAVHFTDEHGGRGDVPIGANLARALRAFRHAVPENHPPRRIWVDAVCINQEDLAERQSQVRLMGRVFGEAARVLCWLGDFADREHGEVRARRAIAFLREFNASPKEHVAVARDVFVFGDEHAPEHANVRVAWLGVKELFDLEYFHRAWIIQEVGLAREARMFWGSSDLWLAWPEVAAFGKYLDYQGASIVNHLQLKSWMANHISFVWEVNDATGEPSFSFVEVLHWARVHLSTDPRDYIFALLSHANASHDGRLLIEPNYTASTETVYTDLAVNVVERLASLEILAFVDTDEKAHLLDLPSWVPDWHAPNLVAPIRTSTNAASASTDSAVVVRTEQYAMLKCHGYLIDSLVATSNMMVPSELTVTTLEKELQKKTPFLIDHVWESVVASPGLPSASAEEMINGLSFVLTGGHRDDVPATPTDQHLLAELRENLAAYVLDFERIRPADRTDGFLADLPPDGRKWVEELASRGNAGHFIQDMTWTSMCRRVFRTAKGHLGLGPRIMRKGDVVVVLQGSRFPMVLRRRGDERFELVGVALLYGFMDGEAERLSLAGELAQQEFCIV